MNRTRLIVDPIAFINMNSNKVWITSWGDKKHKKVVEKMAGYSNLSLTEVNLQDEGIHEVPIEISEDLRVLIEIKGRKYSIQNIKQSNIGSIIKGSTVINGIPKDITFEFSLDSNSVEDGSVRLISENLGDGSEYDSCFNEMVRYTNCKTHKKTKKWVVGHRYDSENDTFWYLGKYHSHMSNTFSEFFNLNDGKVAHLVTRTVKGIKSVSEVLKSQSFRKGEIEAIYSVTSMIDSGEYLEDDVQDISDYWGDLMNNSKTPIEMASILTYVSSDTKDYKACVPKGFKEKLIDLLREPMIKSVVTYWDLSGANDPIKSISKDNSKEVNIKNIANLTWSCLNTGNCLAPIFYGGLMDLYEIDITKLSTEIFNSICNDDSIFNNWSYYERYHKDYFKFRDGSSNLLSDQREREQAKSDKSTISKLYSKSPNLCKRLKEFFKEAVDNKGFPAKIFNVYNSGKHKEKKYYYQTEVTPERFIEWANSKNYLNDDLKVELLNERWGGTILLIDEESEIN